MNKEITISIKKDTYKLLLENKEILRKNKYNPEFSLDNIINVALKRENKILKEEFKKLKG